MLRGGSLFPILGRHIQMLTKAPMHGWIKLIRKLTGSGCATVLLHHTCKHLAINSTLQKRKLGSSARLVKGSVKRTSQSKAWTSVPQKKSSLPGKSLCCVYALTRRYACVRGWLC